MALLQISENGGGEIIPHIKYDGKAGRLFRVDRQPDGTNMTYDITRDPQGGPATMVMDFENAEVGSIWFTNAGPKFSLVRFGEPTPPRPGPDFKDGVRLMVQLHPSIGGDVRELTANSKVFLAGINLLHDKYLAGLSSNPGKLPIVALINTIPITSGSGQQKTTNYQPEWQIVGWVARPPKLIYIPRTGHVHTAAITAPAGAVATPIHSDWPTLASQPGAPPVTGGTQVGPPISGGSAVHAPASPPPAAAAALSNDWG